MFVFFLFIFLFGILITLIQLSLHNILFPLSIKPIAYFPKELIQKVNQEYGIHGEQRNGKRIIKIILGHAPQAQILFNCTVAKNLETDNRHRKLFMISLEYNSLKNYTCALIQLVPR